MTTIEDFSDRPFAAVCLALAMAGFDVAATTAEIEPPEDHEDFRMAVALSQGLTLEVDHDAENQVLSLAVLVADGADREPLLRHALALNDALPPGRTVSLRPTGALAVRGRLPWGDAAKATPDSIAGEAADLVRIAELLDSTAGPAETQSDGAAYSDEIIRG